MRPHEHYLEAERLLEESKEFDIGALVSVAQVKLLRAQVHATLAQVVEGRADSEEEGNGEAGQTPHPPA